MVSRVKTEAAGTNLVRVEFVGLSTDQKPVEVGSRRCANGSAFLEMDTGDLYLFNEDGSEWIKQ